MRSVESYEALLSKSVDVRATTDAIVKSAQARHTFLANTLRSPLSRPVESPPRLVVDITACSNSVKQGTVTKTATSMRNSRVFGNPPAPPYICLLTR